MSIKAKFAQGAVALVLAGASVVGISGGASASPNASYIGYNHVTSGAPVWCVQHSLNHIIDQHRWPQAYGNPPFGKIAEDSSWGNQTYQTVKWYQAWATGSGPDGVVGPQTGQLLLNDGDPYYNGTSWGGWGYCWNYIPSSY
ncbi:peptidoglycan-binding protein [Streptomyces collinus]|uniref:peptidoglycan-binding domain-containing protein n=1 Tax=Streptomyces collinus TaxID=42684 RepID=UPI00368360DC